MTTHTRTARNPWTDLLAIAATGVAVAAMMVVAEWSPRLKAQDAPPPAFEVASVKQNKSAPPGRFVQRQPGGRFNVTNMPLRELIRFAYQIQSFQLEGGPSWLTSDAWDIVAKADGDPPPVQPGGPPDPMMLMLRTLLAD